MTTFCKLKLDFREAGPIATGGDNLLKAIQLTMGFLVVLRRKTGKLTPRIFFNKCCYKMEWNMRKMFLENLIE